MDRWVYPGAEMMWELGRQCEDDMGMMGTMWGPWRQHGDHRAYGGMGMMWGQWG